MKSYSLREKGEENNRGYFEVKGHSAIRSIRCCTYDANASDSYANIQRLSSICHIKLKDENKWLAFHEQGNSVDVEYDYKNQHVSQTVEPNTGLVHVLHQLELPKVRKKIERKDELESIDKQLKVLHKRKRELR